jgi:hypothetical protein
LASDQYPFVEKTHSVNPYEHFFWNFTFFYRKPWAWKVGVGEPEWVTIRVYPTKSDRQQEKEDERLY